MSTLAARRHGVGLDRSLLKILRDCRLTGGLFILQQYGDRRCFRPELSQTITDLSGAGNDFLLGADSSATATDPTWTGNAGGLTDADYLAHDGGDYLRLAAGSNPAAIEAIHKAGADVALMHLFRAPASWGTNVLCGTRGGAFASGFEIRIDSGTPRLGIDNGGGSFNVLDKTAGSSVGVSAFHMLGVSWTASGGGFMYLDGAYLQVGGANTWSTAYSSPSASSAGYRMEIGAAGNGHAPVANGFRGWGFAAWTPGIAKADFDLIWERVRKPLNI